MYIAFVQALELYYVSSFVRTGPPQEMMSSRDAESFLRALVEKCCVKSCTVEEILGYQC